MRVILIFAAFVPLISTEAIPSPYDSECKPNLFYPEGCDEEKNICQISCPGDPKLPCESVLDPCDIDISDQTFDTMTMDKCKELCESSRDKTETSAENRCRFWRWEVLETRDTRQVTSCTLMGGEECNGYKYCGHNCQCGDVGCPGENENDPPHPPDDLQPCRSGIQFHPHNPEKPQDIYIHWACPSDPHSPYNPDHEVPPETICVTTQKCSQWKVDKNPVTELNLKVKCEGKEGKWKHAGNGMTPVYDAVLKGEAENCAEPLCGTEALNELICEPKREELVVTKANIGEGGQISCTTQPEEDEEKYTIAAPNKCILICDFHLGMTIEGRLDETTGAFAFFILETEENITGQPEKVACWGVTTTTTTTTTTTISTTTTTKV